MLKINFLFTININFKKKNNNLKLIFYKNIRKMMFIFFKNNKIFFFNTLFTDSGIRKNLITILKSPFHYKTTKLNISENFKKINIQFVANKKFFIKDFIILEKKNIINSLPTFNYISLKTIKLSFKTKM